MRRHELSQSEAISKPPVGQAPRAVEGVGDFTNWLGAASAGTPQTFSLVPDDGKHLTMTVEAPLTNDLTLTNTVTAARRCGARSARPASTAVLPAAVMLSRTGARNVARQCSCALAVVQAA
ncbi:hypothetical protein GCM10014713_52860 [Streptomyces purpureus]|uniref:Uncharacterized protein n=1 Tax=Streptomyces purpureus TaxID=1951 RepID=A0A918HDB1_9ACTN|nr:hypothetical protein GCM10014713_52860 [Streptomyces purpureus]